MFIPANQTHFSLTIDGFEHDFQVLAFSGEEAISKPYFFTVELVGGQPGMDFQRLVDIEAFLAFDTRGNGVHGRIYHIQQNADRYNLVLVPHLSYLRHGVNRRIYQRFPVPKIIALILEEHGILGDAYRLELKANYRARDYCTQYDETDLHFIQRLCEEEGIHFHFQHSPQGHVLVFGDDQAVFPRIGSPASFGQARGRGAGGSAGQGVMPAAERRYWIDRHEGQGEQPGLASGHVVGLSGYPGLECNDPWLLTEIIHEGKQPRIPGGNAGSAADEGGFLHGYRSRFTVLAGSTTYRPVLIHKKPQVPDQRAVVVALGEQVGLLGRPQASVKVMFPWDREGRFDDKSRCWLSGVSSWGCERTPLRAGAEVTVTFPDGDPDHPLISGCLCCREELAPLVGTWANPRRR